MASPQTIINVHTPNSSLALLHSLNEHSLTQLFDALTRKLKQEIHGARVGPGWVKYHWSDSYWNLDDEGDYTILAWRMKSNASVTLHVHDPKGALPLAADGYQNPQFYLFIKKPKPEAPNGSAGQSKSVKSKKSAKSKTDTANTEGLAHKVAFNKFHSENGVRTVLGSIGPVQNVRMLLKNGYRHVYISRKFAMQHKFIPEDATPGYYGYSGLVNIGTWPITLTPSHHTHENAPKGKTVSMIVYLSEEAHFDVVLGRSFFEKRSIKTDPTDLTHVICLDNDEQVECELVVLKDGNGEIVTVT